MSKLSEMGKILMVGRHLVVIGDQTAAELAASVDVSMSTLKRYIGELRHLGCEIGIHREPVGWVYRIENPDAVYRRLLAWLDLERKRTLLEPIA